MDLNFNEFLSAVQKKVDSLLPDGSSAFLKKSPLNNSLSRDVLLVRKAGSNIAPTIHMDAYYQDYRRGISVDAISADIVRIAAESASFAPGEHLLEISRGEFLDHVFFRVISLSRNKALLKEHPHFVFWDYAIIFYIMIDNNSSGYYQTKINRSLMNHFKCTPEELLGAAMKNTPGLFPIRVEKLEDALGRMMEAPLPPEYSTNMYIVTNTRIAGGAGALFYPGVAEMFESYLDGDYYIIPSSTNEFILLAKEDVPGENEEGINELIREINANELAASEVLGDRVLTYSEFKRHYTDLTACISDICAV